MYDVYLGGVSSPDWIETFKSQIDKDISVFSPYIEDYENLNEFQLSNQIAKELIFMERSDIIVFYFNEGHKGISSLLELGDCVGRGKMVIVCLDGVNGSKKQIKKYCDFRGVIVADTIEDLVLTVEEYIAEVELCSYEDDEE